jgi:hypothetical protein
MRDSKRTRKMGRVLESEVLGDFLGPRVGDELATGGAHLQVGQPGLGGHFPPPPHVIAQALRSPVEEFRQCLDSIAGQFGQWIPIRDSIQITFHVGSCSGFPAMNTRDAGWIFQKIESHIGHPT